MATVIAHPEFEEAMRMVARATIAHFHGNRVVNAFITDRARFLISVFALHFHRTGRADDPLSGLTVSRIRKTCAEQGFCSPGRGEAMVLLMRFFGYLAPMPGSADRRLRRLAPTERLLALHRERCNYTFDAMARLLPEGVEAQKAMALPEFMPAFISHLSRTYLTGFYYVDHVPETRLFLDRNAGMVLLFSLCLAARPGDSFPPAEPVSVSLSASARSFGVSRGHLRKLLQDAVGMGYFERCSDGEAFTILPRLATAVKRALAMYIVHNAHCARLALDEIAVEQAAA
jgi:hypothetical protein